MKKAVSALLSTVVLCSFAACARSVENTSDLSANTGIEIPIALPGVPSSQIGVKDAFNPLTGEYNLARERAGKPVFVVNVDNFRLARPQSGISKADIIFETLTEGGITRLSCLFSDLREVEKIGDVRSLRDQNLESAAYLDPFFIHWGLAVCSEYLLEQYPRLMSLDCNYDPPQELMAFQDSSRVAQGYAAENTWFIDGTKIDDVLFAIGANEIVSRNPRAAFDFRDPEEPAMILSGGKAKRVTFLFSENLFPTEYEYDGEFRYSEASGEYLKWQFGAPQVDECYGDAQLAFRNVLVLFADIGKKGEPYGLLTNLRFQSGGTGYYFSNAGYEEITWGKGDLFEPYWFSKSDGAPLVMNPGKTYVGFVPYELEKSLAIEN